MRRLLPNKATATAAISCLIGISNVSAQDYYEDDIRAGLNTSGGAAAHHYTYEDGGYRHDTKIFSVEGEAGVRTGEGGRFGVGASAEANVYDSRNTVTHRNGDFATETGSRVRVGASGGVEAGLVTEFGVDSEGNYTAPRAEVSAEVFVGQEVSADTMVEDRAGGVLYGAKGDVAGSTGASADASASVGLDGAKLSAGAFAGSKVSANTGVHAAGVGVNAGAEARAGIGIDGDFQVGYDDGKLRLGGEAGAALGVGAGLKANIEIDLNEVVNTVGAARDFGRDRVAPALNKAGENIGNAATTAGNNIKNAANKTRTNVKRTAQRTGQNIKKTADKLKKLIKF